MESNMQVGSKRGREGKSRKENEGLRQSESRMERGGALPEIEKIFRFFVVFFWRGAYLEDVGHSCGKENNSRKSGKGIITPKDKEIRRDADKIMV